jgi:hypothetical protein
LQRKLASKSIKQFISNTFLFSFFELDAETEAFVTTPTDTLECWSNLHLALNERSFPLDKIHRWYMEDRQAAIKEAMRLQFTQHKPLLRVLLDTEDSLLVCCSRFSSSEAELSVGMRERDMRMWCSQTRLNTQQVSSDSKRFIFSNI